MEQSFTVTNVTLRVGQGYQVEFVNPLNESQVYATSQTFSVMPGGSMSSKPTPPFHDSDIALP